MFLPVCFGCNQCLFCHLQVISDPVGYGFVIRGSRPVYVHSVDPNGPAAAAGLKVRIAIYLYFPTRVASFRLWNKVKII